jgi:hypothetical protein
MILDNLTRAFKTQNWLAVATEFVIVIAGVVIGFQVNAWNEGRLQAQQQLVYLDRLQADFVGIDDRLSEHFIVYGEMIEGAAYLLSLLRMSDNEFGAVEIDELRLSRALNALSQQRVPPQSSATYLEMRSEGHLSALQHSELRDKLAEYDQALDIMRDISRMSIDTHIRQFPAVQQHFSAEAVFDESALSGIRRELTTIDLQAMRLDPAVETAIEILETNARNSLAQRRLQRQSIQAVLGLIEAHALT